jgi:hypothetical protein
MVNTEFPFGENQGENMAAKEKTQQELQKEKLENEKKFKELAVKRVNKLIGGLRGLGNLGRFKPTKEQRELVFQAISAEATKAHDRWAGKEVSSEGFKM